VSAACTLSFPSFGGSHRPVGDALHGRFLPKTGGGFGSRLFNIVSASARFIRADRSFTRASQRSRASLASFPDVLESAMTLTLETETAAACSETTQGRSPCFHNSTETAPNVTSNRG